jgi:hypothetical protein
MSGHFKFSLFRNDLVDEEIAQGVVFSNGKVALAGIGDRQVVSVYDSVRAMYEDNCLDGKTRLLWGYSEMAHSRDLLPSLEIAPST